MRMLFNADSVSIAVVCWRLKSKRIMREVFRLVCRSVPFDSINSIKLSFYAAQFVSFCLSLSSLANGYLCDSRASFNKCLTNGKEKATGDRVREQKWIIINVYVSICYSVARMLSLSLYSFRCHNPVLPTVHSSTSWFKGLQSTRKTQFYYEGDLHFMVAPGVLWFNFKFNL